MKVYLLVYGPDFGQEHEVLSLLKNLDSVRETNVCLPNCIFIKSSVNAKILSSKINRLKPNKRFFLSEVSVNRQGWLPRTIWAFLKENMEKAENITSQIFTFSQIP